MKLTRGKRCLMQHCGRTGFTVGQNPNHNSERFTKASKINQIQRFARIPKTALDLL